MTLDQINYLLEIGKTCSISKAANNLFISQSALSLAIQSLERELGQQLFSRTNRGVFPTPYGKAFIRYLTPVQIQLRQIDALFLKGKELNVLTFVLANDGFQVASEVFIELFQKYQSAGVYMKQLDNYSNEGKSLVSSGQADVGFIRLWSCYKKIEQSQLNAMNLMYQQVCSVRVAVGVGPGNPLYRQECEYITPDMLKDFPLVQHEYMDGGPYEDIIFQIGLPQPRSRVVTSSRAVMAEITKTTNAYFVTADTQSLYRPGLQAKLIPIKDCSVEAELGWIMRRGEALTPLAMEYTKLLEQRFI
jgi:DNA-binding transcriptional LysR family regulator